MTIWYNYRDRIVKKIFGIFKNYQFRYLDFRLLLYVVVLTILGILVIGSASDPADGNQKKQIVGMCLGLVLMIITALISYKLIFKFYWIIFVVNALLLLSVTFLGSNHMGAKRWIEISSIRLQPSEMTKILMVIFLAAFIQKNLENLNTLRFLISFAILAGFPLLLIFKQPDLSTTIVIFSTFCLIIFLSGLSLKIVISIMTVCAPVVAVLIYLIVTLPADKNIIQKYQYDRIVGFYKEDKEGEERDPEKEKLMYQQENSVLAIGSGGLNGKGLNNNTITSVKNGNFLSEPHTDFIFTIVGEELGFIGCVSVLLLILLIVFECIFVGGHASDLQGKLFAYGFGCLIAIQTIINVSVVTMLIPNTGLTLPFVSYGLSSLVSLYLGIGIILNIGMQRSKNIYEEVRM